MEDVPLIEPKKETKHSAGKESPSIVMWIILAFGYICNFAEMVYAGFCLMLSITSYAWIPGKQFMAYYSNMCTNFTIFHIYILFVFNVVQCTYALFSFASINSNFPRILYLVAVVFGVISMALSLSVVSADNAFLSMYKRDGAWWKEGLEGDAYDEWEKNTYRPFVATDICRTVFVFFMAFCFVIAFNLSVSKFRKFYNLL